MVCKIVFSSEFSSIPDKASKVTSRRRRRRTQVIAKRCTFQAHAINNTQIDNDKDIDLVIMIIQKNQEVNDNMEMI